VGEKPRDTVGRTDQARQGSAGEDRAAWQGRVGEAFTNVGVALCLREGSNRRTYGDALSDVAQCIAVETLLKLGLPKKYDLDDLGGCDVQVREQPEFVEGRKRHAVGVIDEYCYIPALPVFLQEELLQPGLQRKAIQVCGIQSTGLAQGRQEFRKGDLGVGDDQYLELRWMLLSQIGAQDRCFAYTAHAHDQHKTVALRHARRDGS
jgi:hypothetical protein